MRNEIWANYIKEKRKARKMTRRKLAQLSKIDPSYLRLIERDGCIPRRDKLTNFAIALDVDVNELFIMAGYLPDDMSEEAKENFKTLFLGKGLCDELSVLIKKLTRLDINKQKKAADVIGACIKAVEL